MQQPPAGSPPMTYLMSGHFLQVIEFQRVDGHLGMPVEPFVIDFQMTLSNFSMRVTPHSPSLLRISANTQKREREDAVNDGRESAKKPTNHCGCAIYKMCPDIRPKASFL